MSASSPQPNRVALLMFCLPAVLQGFMHTPAASMIQSIYAKDAGLALGTLGAAVAITRIFDAVIDPLLGWLSDMWRRERGSRKPFIVVGTAVTMVGLWYLLRPPPGVTIGYFTGWFLVAYLGWTITEIPYRAWSISLSSDYATRTRIQVWLAIAAFIGVAVFQTTPYIAPTLGLSTSTVFDLSTLRLVSWIIVVFTPLSIILPLWFVPDGAAPERISQPRLKDLLAETLGNRPLLIFSASFIMISTFGAMGGGVLFLYIDTFLQLAEHTAAILLAVAPASAAGMVVWALSALRAAESLGLLTGADGLHGIGARRELTGRKCIPARVGARCVVYFLSQLHVCGGGRDAG